MTRGWIATLALAATALVPTACAAQSWGYGYGHERQHRDAFDDGFARGQEDGTHHGYSDARHRESFNFWHDREYRNADAGYHGWMGSRARYAEGYRRGYEEGYRRAYARVRGDDRDHAYRNDDWRDRDRRY